MHKYLILLSLFALSACTLGKTETPAPVAQTETPAPAPAPVPPAPVNAVNPTVSLNYTLRDGSPTGTILETTKEDVARANGLYATGNTYKPFEVTLGTKSVIPGFENGLSTMKKGESKMIEVLPKDGYGEAMMTTTVAKGEIAPEFAITTDLLRFQDKITDTVQRSILGEQGTNVAVGQTLTGGANITAVVTKIDGDNITLEIDNKENPFYGKKLEVGAKATKDNADFTITGLTATGISLSIVNRNSPFAGKAFAVGSTATLPATENGPAGEVKVLSMSGDTVELSVPNNHPLAGKTLYFEVEVLDIK